MTLLIGTDEAGYGPNLGPLVVAATAWRIASQPQDAEATLTDAVAAVDAVVAARGRVRSPLWADSKQIYRGGDGFGMLERGVSIGLVLAGAAVPEMWTALADTVGPISPRGGCHGAWQELSSLPLPREADADACTAMGEVSPCAVVTHDLFVGGAPALVGQDSAAVRIGGEWKVAASTWCRVVAIGGEQCP